MGSIKIGVFMAKLGDAARSPQDHSASDPTVSVIIPTFNGGRYIARTIESVLGQTLASFELIVIDDGSDEPISELLAAYADRIVCVRTEQNGPAAARNAGIRIATGDFVALLDHDDLWHPRNLEIQVARLCSEPQCALTYSYPVLIDGDGTHLPNEPPSKFPSGDVTTAFLQRNWITSFSAALVRRSIFQEIGLLDESDDARTCDDYDLWLRISNVAQVLYTPGELVYYRIHAGNLHKNHDQIMRGAIYVRKKAAQSLSKLRRLPSAELEKALKDSAYRTYHRFALLHYYDPAGSAKARRLFWKALVLRPLSFDDAARLAVVCLPPVIRKLAREVRNWVRSRGRLRQGNRPP